MKNRRIAIWLVLLLSISHGGACFAADDWVDDDDVNGFYRHGVQQVDDYNETPQEMQRQPSFSQTENDGGAYQNGSSGFGMQSQFGNSSFGSGSNFGSGQTQTQLQNFGQQVPPKQGFFGKAKNLGKSLLFGADDMLDSPELWQSAGAVAGMGANAYLNYRMMKNNPYYNGTIPYNPYNSYGGYGYGSPYGLYGGGMPVMPGYGGFGGLGGYPMGGYPGYNPYGGYQPPVLGLPYGGTGGYLNFGGQSGFSPFGGYSPYGNSYLNPYVPYSPYGGMGLGNFGGLGGLGLFGRNAVRAPVLNK